MQKSDVFLFTSVAEGLHVVLEAIGNNLPVVCFDTCGQGDAVNDKVGKKIFCPILLCRLVISQLF